jgi:hypothetical protein
MPNALLWHGKPTVFPYSLKTEELGRELYLPETVALAFAVVEECC